MKTYHAALIAFLLGIVIFLLGGIHARLGQLVELGIDAEARARIPERTAELEEPPQPFERERREAVRRAAARREAARRGAELDAALGWEPASKEAEGISASQAQAIADAAEDVFRDHSCPHCGKWVGR